MHANLTNPHSAKTSAILCASPGFSGSGTAALFDLITHLVSPEGRKVGFVICTCAKKMSSLLSRRKLVRIGPHLVNFLLTNFVRAANMLQKHQFWRFQHMFTPQPLHVVTFPGHGAVCDVGQVKVFSIITISADEIKWKWAATTRERSAKTTTHRPKRTGCCARVIIGEQSGFFQCDCA